MKTFKQFINENLALELAVKYAAKKEAERRKKPVDVDANREYIRNSKRMAATSLGFSIGSTVGAFSGSPVGVLAGGAAGAYLGRKTVSE